MSDPTAEVLVKAYLMDTGRAHQANPLQFHVSFKRDQTESGRKILALPRAQQIPVLLYAVAYQVEAIQGRSLTAWNDAISLLAALQAPATAAASTMATLELTGLIAAILRKELPFT